MSDVTDLIEWLDRAIHTAWCENRDNEATKLEEIRDALERINRPADDVVEAARKAIVSYVFSETQPDRGDVFSWLDDHAEQIARAALTTIKQTDAVEAERALVVLREVGRLALSSPDSKTCCQIEQIVRHFLVKRATEIATVGAK